MEIELLDSEAQDKEMNISVFSSSLQGEKVNLLLINIHVFQTKFTCLKITELYWWNTVYRFDLDGFETAYSKRIILKFYPCRCKFILKVIYVAKEQSTGYQS